MRKEAMKLLFVCMLFAFATAAYADDIDASTTGASVALVKESRLGEQPASSDNAQAGNVTDLNLSTSTSTAKWAGYYGEVTASLALGDSSSHKMYNWGNVQNSQIKTVFASTNSAFDFSSVAAASRTTIDTAWNFTGTDTDSANNTLDDTVAGTLFFGLGSLECAQHTNSSFETCALNDGASAAYGNFAFAADVIVDEDDFEGGSSDYELMVPVNTSGIAGTQTYYFFLYIE